MLYDNPILSIYIHRLMMTVERAAKRAEKYVYSIFYVHCTTLLIRNVNYMHF